MTRALAALSLAALLVIPASAIAQQQQAQSDGSGGVGAARTLWTQVMSSVTQAAEEMPEADYAFRPVATVRTFGELVGHIAGAQYMMCAAALGETPRAEDAVEKAAKSKAALVQALKESTAYCAKAYQLTDAAAAGTASLFGQTISKHYALQINVMHDGEHYGNIVTYLRMKGIVPPSSRR